MSKLRLKVDLSDFYSDHRKKAYVCLRPESEKIRCLEKYIRKIFDLSNIAITSLDGVYFPSEESIDIIEANDILKIVSLSADTTVLPEKPKKKKKDKHLQIEHKHENEGNAESNLYSNGGLKVSDVDDHTLGLNCPGTSSKEMLNPDNSLGDVQESISSTTIQRKRKRVRKKKTEDILTQITPPPLKNIKTSKNVSNTTFPQTGNKHIRFDETNNTEKRGGGDNDGEVEKAPIIKWMNILEKIDKSIPRVIHAKVISRSCINETVNVEATNFVTGANAESANANNQLNMCHLTFLKEKGSSENGIAAKSFRNGSEISCS